MAKYRQNASTYVCGIGMAMLEAMTVGLGPVAEAPLFPNGSGLQRRWAAGGPPVQPGDGVDNETCQHAKP